MSVELFSCRQRRLDGADIRLFSVRQPVLQATACSRRPAVKNRPLYKSRDLYPAADAVTGDDDDDDDDDDDE